MFPFKTKKTTKEIKSYTTYEMMPRLTFAPKWTALTTQQAVREGYRRSTWIYACLNIRANNISTVPWKVQRKDAQGDWHDDPRHTLQAVIDRPNEDYDWTTIMKMAQYACDLSGDFFTTIIRSGNRIISLWPLLPDKMEVKPGMVSLVSKYVYYKGSVKKDLFPEEVLHLKYTSPESLYYGISPLVAIARAIDIDEEAEKWQKTMLQNMAIPPGVMEFQDIGQKEYDQAKKWLTEQLDESKRGRPLIMGNGKWQSMGQTANELAFTQSRRLIREEICAGLSVPPPLVGIYDQATLANIETAKKILWDEGLLPVLKERESQINLQLVNEPNVRLKPDLSNVAALQDDYAEKITTATAMFRMGIPLKEINGRLELGLDTDNIPGSDVGYLQSGLLPTDIDMSEFMPGGNDRAREAYGEE